MTRKISLGITAVLVIVSVVVSSLLTLLFVLKTYDSLLVDLPQRAEQYVRLGEIDELIRNRYIGVADEIAIDDSLASGYIKGLNDPYSFYVSEDDIGIFKNNLEGRMEGTGITAYFDTSENEMIVSFIHSGSSADKNGISVNDVIVSVNKESVTPENSQALLDALTTTYDKTVSIVTLRKDGENTVEKSYELKTGFEIASCVYSVENSIGYIKINAFYSNTSDIFSDAIEHFTSKDINKVILDLRNSSGQNFDVAAEIIDRIVPVGTEGSGVIFSAKNSAGDIISQYSSDSDALNMKFAVLVNTRTEAAAELIAADIKDFGKGILIGENTAGCGTMQQLFSLSSGGAVYLSVAEVYPYISSTFNKVGLIPDVIVETSESFKNQLGNVDFSDDEQYKAAVSYFSSKK